MKPKPIESLGNEFIEELDTVLTSVVHDVRASSSLISGAAEILGEDNDGTLNDTQRQLVDIMGKSARKLLGQMDYVAVYLRLRLWDTPDRERISLAQLLEWIQADYKNHYLGELELLMEAVTEELFISCVPSILAWTVTELLVFSGQRPLKLTVSRDNTNRIKFAIPAKRNFLDDHHRRSNIVCVDLVGLSLERHGTRLESSVAEGGYQLSFLLEMQQPQH